MFTGIVHASGKVEEVKRGSILISAGFESLELGESISMNGVCLTVSEIAPGKGKDVVFGLDVSPETLDKTNLGGLRRGMKVNLERAMKANDRFGGHIVTGHIDGVGRVKSIRKQLNFLLLEIILPEEMLGNIVSKGSIAVDGVSLTVNELSSPVSFTVSIIPHTIEITNIESKRAGEIVNIELDIIGKYVRKGLEKNKGKITEVLLKEEGF